MRWLSLFSLFLLPSTVAAFTSGAGSCPAGKSAASGSHLKPRDTFVSGSLEDLNVQMKIAGKTATAFSRIQVEMGQQVSLEIIASADSYRGALIRLEGGSKITDMDLQPSTNAVVAEACDFSTATGITHESAALKTLLKGAVTFYTVGEVIPMDVTVVVANNATHSITGFTRYMVTVVGGGGPTTPVPSPGNNKIPTVRLPTSTKNEGSDNEDGNEGDDGNGADNEVDDHESSVTDDGLNATTVSLPPASVLVSAPTATPYLRSNTAGMGHAWPPPVETD